MHFRRPSSASFPAKKRREAKIRRGRCARPLSSCQNEDRSISPCSSNVEFEHPVCQSTCSSPPCPVCPLAGERSLSGPVGLFAFHHATLTLCAMTPANIKQRNVNSVPFDPLQWACKGQGILGEEGKDSQGTDAEVLVAIESAIRRIASKPIIPMRWLRVVSLFGKRLTLFDGDAANMLVGPTQRGADGAVCSRVGTAAQSASPIHWEPCCFHAAGSCRQRE